MIEGFFLLGVGVGVAVMFLVYLVARKPEPVKEEPLISVEFCVQILKARVDVLEKVVIKLRQEPYEVVEINGKYYKGYLIED